ncbi:hypothetical protein SAMN04244553_5101 [Nocardia amikacinitolerans]|uniref:DUF4254 domain-containing protein n=1 Tax=Nocardia amikacinitolerans TaxID=756689 RepID=A0A285LTA5_9NOCA|nr:DUF4254 domain-containing protein [Nocardia amikacinitolerans]SNY88139.1 hypothetical protein SAMN04244553_5101 [Nocardia amikacinitolerans]
MREMIVRTADYRSRPTLPGWRELSAAFRGAAGCQPGEHLVLRWAHALAHLHRTRITWPTEQTRIDSRRGELRTLIDDWVTVHIQPRQPWSRTTGYGQAVDDMAVAHVAAEIVLSAEHTADELHRAWSHVGYLATCWADLVTEAVDGQRTLPPRPLDHGLATEEPK